MSQGEGPKADVPGKGGVRCPDLKARFKVWMDSTSDRGRGEAWERKLRWGKGHQGMFQISSGHKCLNPSYDWLKHLAPVTKKSVGGLQAQLDPGVPMASP